jgi:hypothetical protein
MRYVESENTNFQSNMTREGAKTCLSGPCYFITEPKSSSKPGAMVNRTVRTGLGTQEQRCQMLSGPLSEANNLNKTNDQSSLIKWTKSGHHICI